MINSTQANISIATGSNTGLSAINRFVQNRFSVLIEGLTDIITRISAIFRRSSEPQTSSFLPETSITLPLSEDLVESEIMDNVGSLPTIKPKRCRKDIREPIAIIESYCNSHLRAFAKTPEAKTKDGLELSLAASRKVVDVAVAVAKRLWENPNQKSIINDIHEICVKTLVKRLVVSSTDLETLKVATYNRIKAHFPPSRAEAPPPAPVRILLMRRCASSSRNGANPPPRRIPIVLVGGRPVLVGALPNSLAAQVVSLF